LTCDRHHSSDPPDDDLTPPLIPLGSKSVQGQSADASLGVGGVSIAMGKRKHLLSKINEKKGTEGSETTVENDSKTSDQSGTREN
jgi:hypothetical protein